MKTSELPKVDYRSVKPLQGNLKDLTEDNFEKLKRVLEKRGFDVPLFMWNGFILDGHQRVRVAQKIDLKPYEVPYIEIEAKDENEAKKRVLEISSQYGTITQEGYDEFTADLPEAELVETTHFDALGNFPDDPEVEEDEPPEVSKEPAVSQLGEVYQLGRHRLMCGDATKDVETLMDGVKADMVLTDPPYGIDLDVDYDEMYKDPIHKPTGKRFNKVIGDDKDYDPTQLLKEFEYVEEIFLWGGDYYCRVLPQGSWLVWDKRHNDSGMKLDDLIGSSFEVCWSKKPHKKEILRVLWSGHHGMQQEDTKSRVHPTQKPTSLAAWFLRKYSNSESVVVDVFGGSGSTLIACEQLDRTCYMMELDPRYTDVIRKRWVKLVHSEQEDDWEKLTPKV